MFLTLWPLAELRSGTVLDIMPREASPAEGLFVEVGYTELIRFAGNSEHGLVVLHAAFCRRIWR